MTAIYQTQQEAIAIRKNYSFLIIYNFPGAVVCFQRLKMSQFSVAR
jgi:hypothetical protein